MSYGNDPKCRRDWMGVKFEPSTDWRAFTIRRLLWLYNDQARAEGTSPAALADLAAWRKLGQRSAA